jgi:hypothetical protein
VLPTLVARVHSYAFRSCPYGEGQGQVLYLNGQLVPLTLEEREYILDYPTESTNTPGLSYSARHHILGSCFDAFAVSHLFACAFALCFSMLCLSDSHLFSHVSELGGGQLDSNIPNDLTSLFDSGQEFLQLAAQQLLMSTGSAIEWDLFIPWIALGYRATPHESTKLSPYKLLYACDPIVPSSTREALIAPINFDDFEQASQSIIDRSLLLAEHCATTGQNLLITQRKDTLRYAKLMSGAYTPLLREFKKGFTPLTIETLWATDRFHRDAKRALEFRPTSGPHHK